VIRKSQAYECGGLRPRSPRAACCGKSGNKFPHSKMLAAIITAFYVTSVPAGETLPGKLDLATAVALAHQHNPTLKEIDARVDEQDGKIEELYAARKPELTLVGNGSELDQGRLQSFGDFSPESTTWNATAEAVITVYSGGRSLEAIRAEKARMASLGHQREAAMHQITTDVHEAFYDAQLASENILVQEQVIQLLEKQLNFTRNRLQAGVGEHFDVLQGQVALANAQPALIRARNTYRRNIDLLRIAIGLPYPEGLGAADIALIPSEVLPDFDLQVSEALSSAEARRPELQELDRLAEATRHQIEVSVRNDRPFIDLFADYAVESDQFGGTDYLDGWKTGVRLNWTFYDSGKTRSLVKQGRARLDQIQYQRAALLLTISSQIRQAFYDYEEAQAILSTTGQVTEQAEAALGLAENRYQAGRGTQLEILQSQLQLTQSLLEDITALNTLQKSVIRIKRAAGIPIE
jgi:outer membrane protein